MYILLCSAIFSSFCSSLDLLLTCFVATQHAFS
jgi:hypothetical protein